MTRAEIRHHALQIAEMRRSNRSKGQKRRVDRGFDTAQDFKQDRVWHATYKNITGGTAAVDQMFRAYQEYAGFLPKGSWS